MSALITRQEIFDKVAPALLKQNKKSLRLNLDGTMNGCMYRGCDNTKCAIGFLIPDDHPACYMEADVFGLLDMHKDLMPVLGFNGTNRYGMDSDDPYDQDHISFLNDLQKIHDYKPVIEWKARLIDLASAWNLDSSCIATCSAT